MGKKRRQMFRSKYAGHPRSRLNKTEEIIAETTTPAEIKKLAPKPVEAKKSTPKPAPKPVEIKRQQCPCFLLQVV